MRQKKLVLNSITSLVTQLATIVCGMIVPRLIMVTYGSTVNGLVSSISQFLSIITLLDFGVGSVMQAALYKPLAEGDNAQISKVMVSAQRFFRRIAQILIIYVIVLILVYPYISKSIFDRSFTISLIVIIAVSSFAQYYWGIANQILLNADQRIYIQTGLQCLVLILNTVCCFVLVNVGASIQIVKLASTIVFVLRPILMQIYVKKHYSINKKILFQEEPIKQKWNGVAQHIASYVLDNTDIVVLTLFSTYASVSVYMVYYNVVSGIRKLLISVFNSFQSLWGNMIAKGEKELLEQSFDKIEWIIHNIVIFFFGVTGALILPFIKLYTNGVEDINYILPYFAVIIVLANAMHCLRLPYMMIIYSAGEFKETQASAWIEAASNIIFSILLVVRFDLPGVALGTFIAMTYRTIYLAYYLSKHILHRCFSHFCKRILLDAFCVGDLYLILKFIKIQSANVTVLGWIIMAVEVAFITLLCILVTNIFFERHKLKNTFCNWLKK